MGAALTYARRYALFTMVGIAGEDDLDAPPDVTNDRPAQSTVEAGLASNPSAAPAPSASPFRNGNSPPVGKKLNAEEPAAIRARLTQEIETLPQDDLQARAINILKAKNRLSADDAKQVEQAFAAKMAPQGASPEAPSAEEPASAPTDPSQPQPPLAPMDAVKRPRGRPRRVKAPIDLTEAPPIPLASAIADNPAPPSTHLHADAAPAKIQKSELTISEPRRHRDKAHLKFVASQPCLVCGRSPADAHHLRFTQARAMGRKVSDEFTVPLCRSHHRDNHRFGDEVTWWERRAIDPVATSRMLWVSTRRIE